MAEIMLGIEAATRLNEVSMSDNTAKRRIEDINSDILAQIVHGMKNNAFPIVLQLDESIDAIWISQVLVFVRYVQKEKTKFELKEEFLFCESLQLQQLRQMSWIQSKFLEKHDISLEKIGFVYTDGALAVLGCKSWFVALLKNMNPSLIIIHCILHRYALMSKTLPW